MAVVRMAVPAPSNALNTIHDTTNHHFESSKFMNLKASKTIKWLFSQLAGLQHLP
jgi:hypothetical protein